MPCPFVRSTEYPTSAHRLHLCENPTRDGEVYAPDLGKLRDYCLRDGGYETCPGYKAARKHCTGPAQGTACALECLGRRRVRVLRRPIEGLVHPWILGRRGLPRAES